MSYYLFILNDAANEHSYSNGNHLNVDIIGMAYAFANRSDSALNQTIFVNYEIFNRSIYNYKNVYLASFTDFDIGYAQDDYIGYDSLQNMCYGYNGIPIDGTGLSSHYGSHPPAQGVKVLNTNVSKFLYFKRDGHQNTNDPDNSQDYYNYMRGKWKDGAPMTYGGYGYNPLSTAYCNYMFTGYPEDSTGWTEKSLNNNPVGNRRGMMSVGPLNFDAGEKITLDLAFIFARDYTGNNLSSVALLRQRAQAIQNHYNNGIGIEDVKSKNIDVARIYPNPNKGNFNIVLSQKPDNSEIFIYNLQGKLLTSKKLNTEFSTIDMQENKGMYIYLIKSKNEIIGKGKLIVE